MNSAFFLNRFMCWGGMNRWFSLAVLIPAGLTTCLKEAAASPAEEIFNRANAAYVSGDYAAAIRDYESLAARGCFSAPIFYNLGNAYFRDGRIGPAVLNYERALWLAPGDAEVKANLQLARRSAGLFESAPAGWRSIPAALSLDTWTVLAGLSFLLGCIVAAVRILKGNTGWNTRPWLILLTLAWLVSAGAAAARLSELNGAVVVVPEASLRVTPLESSPAASRLAAGRMVHIRKERGGFFYVRSPDGKTGWLSKKEIQAIVPR